MTETPTRERVQAVVFSLLIVLSPIAAVPITFSGTATAASGNLPAGKYTFDNSEPSDWETRGTAQWGIDATTDPNTRNVLELTDDKTYENGAALYDKGIDSGEGFTVDFKYWAESGTSNNDDTTVDGISVFLLNGNKVDDTNFDVGGIGGGLSYSHNDDEDDDTLKSSNTNGANEYGIPHGYLGIGLHQTDFFSTTAGDMEGGASPGVSQGVTLRGEGNGGSIGSGYKHLTTADPGEEIEYDETGPVYTPWRIHYTPIYSSGGDDVPDKMKVRVEADFNDDSTYTEVVTHTYDNAPPSLVKLGFGGSTGSKSGAHLIDDVEISHNSAPSFTGDVDLGSTNEDTASSSSTIDSLLSGKFDGPETIDSFDGVVVTGGASASEGNWQYKTGSTWYDIGSVSSSSGLKLSKNAEIRFNPATNYNGEPSDLQVHAVDDSTYIEYTSGSTRKTHDTTADGSNSPVSSSSNKVDMTVTDVNDNPTADAGSDISTTAGSQFNFDGSGSSDVDGSISTYEWDVDDDSSYELSGSSPAHTYSNTGSKTVTLRVTDDDGATATDTLTVDVNSQSSGPSDSGPPTADAGSDITIAPGEWATVDGSGSTDDNSITTYRWEFPTDGPTQGSGATMERKFYDAGTYTATLTVTDQAGKTDTDTVTITVSEQKEAPTADAGDSGADQGAVAFASGASGKDRNAIRIADAAGTTAELDPKSKALGPATGDFDGDGLVELPHVVTSGKNAGNLRLIDSDGETTTLVEQGQNSDGTDVAQSKTILAVGSWDGSSRSVFYVDKSKSTIYRVAPDGDPAAVVTPDDGASAVLGIADLDSDSSDELVFLDSAGTVRYLEPDDTVSTTGVTVGANNGLGAGAPADVDSDGTPRVPVVTGSGDLALVSSDGSTTLTSNGPAEKAPVAASDLDGDGTHEIGFVAPAPERTVQYVDDVGSGNSVETLADGIAAFDHAGVVASATSASADKTVETGTEVSFDGSDSTDDGSIDSYEWDIDGDGSYEQSGQSVSNTFDTAGTQTVRLRVTDNEGVTATDSYTVVVETSQEDVSAGLTPQAGYHGTLANTGHYTGESGPTAEPEILWERSLNTVFANQPTIADGTLYVAPHNGGKLRALDPATGDQEWATTPGGNDGTTWSAPAVVDGTLYVGSNDYKFHAIDAGTGAELWNYSTQTNVRSAPAVVDGVVYFGSNDGNMTAVNATTGEELWHHTLYQPVRVESNPAVVDGVVYFGSHGDNVTALNATTGDKIWNFPTDGDPVGSDPTVVNDTVYVGSGHAGGSSATGTHEVYALRGTDGTERWNHTLTGQIDSGQAYADGVVYAGSRGGDFVALDAEDGSVVWEQSGGDFRGAPIVADGVVYVNDFGQGTVKAFDAETGEEVWTFDSPTGNLYGTPAVHDGTLYYGSGSKFYALGIPDPLPTADAGTDITGDEEAEIQFDGSESTDDSGIDSYDWTFGDGGTATGVTPTYTYETDGEYNATLSVTDTAGQTASDSVGVTVVDTSVLIADAGTSTNTSADEDTQVEFDASDSESNEGIESYEWAFGDGSTASGATVSHTYEEPGSYTATLTLTDSDGNTATDTINVTVEDTTAPTVDLGGDQSADTGDTVSFDPAAVTDNGDIVSYNWEFGDGEFSSNETASHTYDEPGTYEVTLTVTDAGDNSASATMSVNVTRYTGPEAVSQFRADLGNTGFFPDQFGPEESPDLAREFTLETIQAVEIQPAIADGTVYMGSRYLYGYDLQTGERLWRFDTGEAFSTSPSVVDDTLYIGGGDGKVYALHPENGTVDWAHDTGSEYVSTAPAVSDGTVYVGHSGYYAGNFSALDADTGEQLWSYDAGARIFANPAVDDDTVYFGTDNKSIIALDAETGEERWTFETDGNVRDHVTVVNGTVYATSRQSYGADESPSRVYAIDPVTGDERWSYAPDGDVTGGPAVANGTVYVTNEFNNDPTSLDAGGNLIALDAEDGSVEWEHGGLAYRSSPIVADGVVYAYDEGRSYYPNGKENCSTDWDAENECIPEIPDPSLQALDADTGEQQWAYQNWHLTAANLLAYNGAIYMGAHPQGDKALYELGEPRMSVETVDVTNPADRTVNITVETDLEAESLSATVSEAESATLSQSAFTETNTSSGYRYTTTYEGSSYGTYNVSVSATDFKGNTDTGEDGVRIKEPLGVRTTASEATFKTGSDPIVVDGDVHVNGGDDQTIEGAKVIVEDGFAEGDTLAYDADTANASGVTGTYSPETGVLTFSGSATPEDYQAILRTVTFESAGTENASSVDREISFSLGRRASYSAATGHYYEYVDNTRTWKEARDAASEKTYFGMEGYLVTVTSAEENNFVSEKIDGNTWMGASDDSRVESDWYWVTGPEERDGWYGLQFFHQTASASGDNYYDGATPGGGDPVDGQYNNWADGEPNNWDNNEDYAGLYTDGKWNDFAVDNSDVDGFVVEYGGMPDDPEKVQLSDTTTVTVRSEDNTAPTADAGGDISTKEGTAAVFDAGDSADNVAITSYEWEFGNGETGSGETTTHVYDQPGTYEATLTVADEAGNEDTASTTVTVTDVTLVPKTGLEDETVRAGETITLDATNSKSSEGIDSYEWDLDTDGETDATKPVQKVSYETPGDYESKLTITDTLGNTKSTVTELTVEDSTEPEADAGESRRTTAEGSSVTFDASNSTDNGQITSYEWDFDGDGETDATGESVTHPFDDPGVYPVTLTVTDAGGNTDTTVQTVEVADVTDPTADAGADITVNQSETVTASAANSSDNVGIVQYGWDLTGDGEIDRTGETVSGSYDQAGTYDVTLVVRDAANNTDRDTLTATVLDSESPAADLQASNITGATNQTIVFDAAGSSDNTGIARYDWDFGDGTIRTTRGGVGGGTTEIAHTYEEEGEFTVRLRAVDRQGNTDTDTVNVTVFDTSTLTAGFGAENATTSEVRAGTPITFNASSSQSSAEITSYEWDFDGDGETDATGVNATTSYDELGNHTVELTVTDPLGNTATATQNVTVVDTTPPDGTTGSDARTVAEDEAATFDATASTDNDQIASYEWEFDGDGTTDATGSQPNYTFGEPGEQLVTLTVTDAEGNTDTTTMTVTVTDQTAPQVVVESASTVAQNEQITLDAGRTTDNGEITSYEWNLDGDSETDRSGETATTTFETVGTRNVTLTVTDSAGNSATRSTEIEVTDATPPVAEAGSSLSVLEGAAIDFEARNSTDNVGITSYEWAFGDGATATGPNATHTYENDGRYTAELTATDAADNTATDTLGVAVINGSLLVADAGQSRIEASQGESVDFDATGSLGEDGLAGYEWDFDGDGEFEGTGPTPSHTYTRAGTQTVTLRVTDDAGNVMTDTLTVDVQDTEGPVAALGTNSEIAPEDEPVAFYASRSSDNTEIERYAWDFDGDGVTDTTAETPTHVFEDPGTQEVTLTVTDRGGNTDTVTRQITVSDETAPTVDLVGDTEATAGSTVDFGVGDSTDNVGITGYEWAFGDGETATGSDVSHTYDSAGEYTVRLTAEDRALNTASATVTVTVEDNATLQASAGSNKSVAPGTAVTLDATDSTASAGIESYQWTFGDGTADAGPVSRHTYVERGTYTVTLTITDTKGRTATDNTTVHVADQSSPSVDAGPDRQIEAGSPIRISADDSFDNRGIDEFTWEMGDGNSITTTQPAISYWYDEPGTYPVTLTVTDDAGNTGTDVTVVEVLPADSETNETEVATVSAGENGSVEEEDRVIEDGLRIRVSDGESESDTDDTEDRTLRRVGSRSVRVENVREGSQLSVGLEESESTDQANVTTSGNIFMDRLDLTSQRDGDFDLNVDTREVNLDAISDPDTGTTDLTMNALSKGSKAFVSETGARPAGFIEIDHTVSDENISGVNHHFRVRKSYLNATGVGPDAVTLYREETDRQNPLETELVAETDEFYHYRAESPGLSRFTIGTQTPVFEISDARVLTEGIETGQPVTVEATVENVGNASGTYEGQLLVDGTVVTNTSVTIPPGESRQVQLNYTFTEPGNHTLALGSQNVSTVAVSEAGAGGPGLVVILGLVVLVVLLLLVLLWRRRDDEDEEETEEEHAQRE